MTTYGPCYKIKAALSVLIVVHLLFRFLLGETLLVLLPFFWSWR
jgi:hypothetical protein